MDDRAQYKVPPGTIGTETWTGSCAREGSCPLGSVRRVGHCHKAGNFHGKGVEILTIEQELQEFLEKRNVDWGLVANIVRDLTDPTHYSFIDKRSMRIVEVEVK